MRRAFIKSIVDTMDQVKIKSPQELKQFSFNLSSFPEMQKGLNCPTEKIKTLNCDKFDKFLKSKDQYMDRVEGFVYAIFELNEKKLINFEEKEKPMVITKKTDAQIAQQTM